MNYPQQPYPGQYQQPPQQAYPQQAPPAQPMAPSGYPQQVQQPYPGQFQQPQAYPQQGYPQQPQQPPAPPLAEGSLDAFYSQPSASTGPSLSFADLPLGSSFVGVVTRDVTNADIQQQTNPQGMPQVFRDGRPKYVMKVPLRLAEPHPKYPEGEATWYVKGQARDELVRAMSAAGQTGSPKQGALVRVTLVGKRPSGAGYNPSNVFQVEYVPDGQAQGAALPQQQGPAQPQAPAQAAPQWSGQPQQGQPPVQPQQGQQQYAPPVQPQQQWAPQAGQAPQQVQPAPPAGGPVGTGQTPQQGQVLQMPADFDPGQQALMQQLLAQQTGQQPGQQSA